MKKIFYICTKHIENWDIFTPPDSIDITSHNISVLLLHREQDMKNVRVSQVCYLNLCEQDTGDRNTSAKNISYQEFLEQVFVHDLALVI